MAENELSQKGQKAQNGGKKLNQKKRITNSRWDKDNIKMVAFPVRIEFHPIIKTAAENAGLSVSSYVRQAVMDKMKADGFPVAYGLSAADVPDMPKQD